MSERYDANSGVVSEALTFLRRVRAQRYRPTRFRSIVPVASGDVPAFATRLRTETVKSFASFVPGNQASTVLPLATEEITEAFLPIVKYRSAYNLLDDELAAYASEGKNPSAVRVLAIQTRAEQVLNNIAALGDASAGLFGLFNNPNIAATSPDLTRWSDATSTAEVVVAELEGMLEDVEDSSLELHAANRIVLPTPEFRYANTVRSTVNSATALDIFRASNPGVAVIKWNKADGLGANSTGRAVAFDANAEVLSMVIPVELLQGKRIDTHTGVEIGMSLKTAGLVIDEPLGVVYRDFDS